MAVLAAAAAGTGIAEGRSVLGRKGRGAHQITIPAVVAAAAIVAASASIAVAITVTGIIVIVVLGVPCDGTGRRT
jgi:hypothetical protein